MDTAHGRFFQFEREDVKRNEGYHNRVLSQAVLTGVMIRKREQPSGPAVSPLGGCDVRAS